MSSYSQEFHLLAHGYQHYESRHSNVIPQGEDRPNTIHNDHSLLNTIVRPSFKESPSFPSTLVEGLTTPITDLSLNTYSGPLSDHHVPTSYSTPVTWSNVSGHSSAAQNWMHLTTTTPPTTALMITSTEIPAMTPSTAPATNMTHKPRVECIFCDKTFPNRTRATAHMYKHMNVKPFACNGTCGIATW
jgi:hypothetical protein